MSFCRLLQYLSFLICIFTLVGKDWKKVQNEQNWAFQISFDHFGEKRLGKSAKWAKLSIPNCFGPLWQFWQIFGITHTSKTLRICQHICGEIYLLQYLLKTHYISNVSKVLKFKVYKVCHMKISWNFSKVQESYFTVFLPCFSSFACACIYLLVHILLWLLTIAGEDPPVKIPTLPFKPPEFN